MEQKFILVKFNSTVRSGVTMKQKSSVTSPKTQEFALTYAYVRKQAMCFHDGSVHDVTIWKEGKAQYCAECSTCEISPLLDDAPVLAKHICGEYLVDLSKKLKSAKSDAEADRIFDCIEAHVR